MEIVQPVKNDQIIMFVFICEFSLRSAEQVKAKGARKHDRFTGNVDHTRPCPDFEVPLSNPHFHPPI
jgi:hypothetical protein